MMKCPRGHVAGSRLLAINGVIVCVECCDSVLRAIAKWAQENGFIMTMEEGDSDDLRDSVKGVGRK